MQVIIRAHCHSYLHITTVRVLTYLYKLIVQVSVVLRRTAGVGGVDWRFDTLSGCHVSHYHQPQQSFSGLHYNLDDQLIQRCNDTPGFKPFTLLRVYCPHESHDRSLIQTLLFQWSRQVNGTWGEVCCKSHRLRADNLRSPRILLDRHEWMRRGEQTITLLETGRKPQLSH